MYGRLAAIDHTSLQCSRLAHVLAVARWTSCIEANSVPSTSHDAANYKLHRAWRKDDLWVSAEGYLANVGQKSRLRSDPRGLLNDNLNSLESPGAWGGFFLTWRNVALPYGTPKQQKAA